MNYKRIYNELILKRKTNPITIGYKEKHHIKMKSLGGDNSKENMVYLTAREHFVAHSLLHKFMKCSQTAYALWMMQMKTEEMERAPFIRGSRMYEWARLEFVKYHQGHTFQIGEKNSQYGKKWICNIELEKNKRISKNEKIPAGWCEGRSRWNKIKRLTKFCKYCRSEFIANSIKQLYCSAECKANDKRPEYRDFIDEHFEEIIEIFNQTNSIQKTLVTFGFDPKNRLGNTYLSNKLKDIDKHVLKRRNSS